MQIPPLTLLLKITARSPAKKSLGQACRQASLQACDPSDPKARCFRFLGTICTYNFIQRFEYSSLLRSMLQGYWHYFKDRDLGFVFRVDRDHTVHVAGVRPGSPASRLGISHSWRLLAAQRQNDSEYVEVVNCDGGLAWFSAFQPKQKPDRKLDISENQWRSY